MTDVALTALDRRVAPFRALLVGPVTYSGGIGGWQEVSRPRRRAAVEWTGHDARRIVMPLRIDGMESSRGVDSSVEPMCNLLTALASRVAGTKRPAVLALAGLVTRPAGSRWVIETLEWGEETRRAGSRTRIRQDVAVGLVEFAQADVLLGPAAAARSRSGR